MRAAQEGQWDASMMGVCERVGKTVSWEYERVGKTELWECERVGKRRRRPPFSSRTDPPTHHPLALHPRGLCEFQGVGGWGSKRGGEGITSKKEQKEREKKEKKKVHRERTRRKRTCFHDGGSVVGAGLLVAPDRAELAGALVKLHALLLLLLDPLLLRV